MPGYFICVLQIKTLFLMFVRQIFLLTTVFLVSSYISFQWHFLYPIQDIINILINIYILASNNAPLSKIILIFKLWIDKWIYFVYVVTTIFHQPTYSGTSLISLMFDQLFSLLQYKWAFPPPWVGKRKKYRIFSFFIYL